MWIGIFTNYTTANGLVSNNVSSIAEGVDGTMWFGTSNGVSALSKSTWRSYGVRNGLVSPDVNCLLLDSIGVLWIGTAEGLAFFSAGQVHIPRNVPDSLHEQIYGMAEGGNGWLWIASASHVLQVKRSSLLGDHLVHAPSQVHFQGPDAWDLTYIGDQGRDSFGFRAAASAGVVPHPKMQVR